MKLGERLKQVKLLRSFVYALVGFASYPGLVWVNRIKIQGTEYLEKLPKKNVLFVSNHQTYFTDVIAFLHIFCAVKWRKKNRLGMPYYLLNPFTNVFFIAAEETMNGNLISRLFKLAGAISIKRTWRSDGKDIERNREESDTQKIDLALQKSWVITFPQGTTKPFAPGRKGTAHIIKNNQPIVVPVVINGFWRAFSKTGLSFKKKGVKLSIRIKAPLIIDYTKPIDVILAEVMHAIEQDESYKLKGKHHRIN
jgi:1-acyl-sn-glycerol-3-phosphate acyltransferase